MSTVNEETKILNLDIKLFGSVARQSHKYLITLITSECQYGPKLLTIFI